MKFLLSLFIVFLLACEDQEAVPFAPTIDIGETIPLNETVRIVKSGIYLVPFDAETLTTFCDGRVTQTIKYAPLNVQTKSCTNGGNYSSSVRGISVVTYELEAGASADLLIETL